MLSCLFGLLNVACFVQMDIFGSGVGPVLSGLVPPLALFSPRLPRHDGRAQGGMETGVCTDGSVRVCEGRESAVKRCHYTGRITRNRLLSTVPGERGKRMSVCWTEEKLIAWNSSPQHSVIFYSPAHCSKPLFFFCKGREGLFKNILGKYF